MNFAQEKIEKAKIKQKYFPVAEQQIIGIKLYYLEKQTPFILMEINNNNLKNSNTKPQQLQSIVWINKYNKKLNIKKTMMEEDEMITKNEVIELAKITSIENVSQQDGQKLGLDENQIAHAFNLVLPEYTICLISLNKEKKSVWMDGLLVMIGKEKMTSPQMAMEVNELLEIKYEMDVINQILNNAPNLPQQPKI